MSGFSHTLRKPVTMTLKAPGQPDQVEQLMVITLRKPMAGDARALDVDGGENAATIALIAHLSGVPQIYVDRLCAADYVTLSGWLEQFLAEPESESITNPLTLSTPIQRGEGEAPLVSIEVREPTAGDFRISDRHAGENAATLAMIAHLSGVAVELVDQFEFAEYRKLSLLLGNFIVPGPAA